MTDCSLLREQAETIETPTCFETAVCCVKMERVVQFVAHVVALHTEHIFSVFKRCFCRVGWPLFGIRISRGTTYKSGRRYFCTLWMRGETLGF